MPVKFTMRHPILRAWALYHQTYNLLYRCEEVMFSKVGLTSPKYMILMAIKLINDPVTSSDIARWLDRNTNSVSLIIDRMEKDGLVKRPQRSQNSPAGHDTEGKGKIRACDSSRLGSRPRNDVPALRRGIADLC